jgi:uroporphyrinogen decarboxylase
VIYFGTGTAGLLTGIEKLGAGVIGLDWRLHLDDAWRTLGWRGAVQGNLDPAALLADWTLVEERAKEVLRRAGQRNGHIFNLGHGIFPETPVENVARLVDFVHEEGVRMARVDATSSDLLQTAGGVTRKVPPSRKRGSE